MPIDVDVVDGWPPGRDKGEEAANAAKKPCQSSIALLASRETHRRFQRLLANSE